MPSWEESQRTMERINILSKKSDYVVIEADEFDRSFHWLRPWMSVITSTDPDHLDIYGTKEAYLESFRHYTELIQEGGALIIHKDLEMKQHVKEGVKVYDYSRNTGDFHAENIRIENGTITFDFISPVENVKDVETWATYSYQHRKWYCSYGYGTTQWLHSRRIT